MATQSTMLSGPPLSATRSKKAQPFSRAMRYWLSMSWAVRGRSRKVPFSRMGRSEGPINKHAARGAVSRIRVSTVRSCSS